LRRFHRESFPETAMRLHRLATSLMLLAASAHAAPEPSPPPAVAQDAALVARCNAAAVVRPLTGGAVAQCSEAYERLLAYYGGYQANRAAAAQRDRAAKTGAAAPR
jgi:hypothetical protein